MTFLLVPNLVPGMPESLLPSRRLVEFLHLVDFHLRHGRDQHLRDAHAALDDERLLPVIDQWHLYFAAVVRIDGAGRVDHGDAELAREPAARSYLRLVPVRNRHREPARD